MAEVLKRQIIAEDVEFDVDGLEAKVTCKTSTDETFQGSAINASHIPLPLASRPNVGDSVDVAEAFENLGMRVNAVELMENETAISALSSATEARQSELNAATHAFSCSGSVTITQAAKEDIEAKHAIIEDTIENLNINTVNLELGDRFVGSGHLDYGSRF